MLGLPKKTPTMKNLKKSLTEFLKPRVSQEECVEIKERNGGKINWIRFRQKPPDQKTFFVDDKFHDGSHMNLMVFLDNPKSSRSKESDDKRKQRQPRATSRGRCASVTARRDRSQPATTKPAVASSWGASQWGGASWNASRWSGASRRNSWWDNAQWHQQPW